MATDFFERQAAARRTTKWLIAVFALAVAVIVGTTVLVAAVAVDYSRELAKARAAIAGHTYDDAFFWQIPLWAGGGSLALIVGGTLYKIAQLLGGGTVVAENLGGRRVYPNTPDPIERRLLNVIEEMAIASGVPVPPVFLLNDERGINAFAAGYSPSDAVIGVTRGAAEQLSRDELQGVVAHEFSHVVNGDMRLNLRLIGVLHGILLLSLVGREILTAAARGSGSRRSDKNGGVIYILAIGLVLLVLGFLGSIIGNLIKAAVSRQREFLADASAVQFTRNPGGIAGALKRIGGATFGSKLVAPAAAEASHMYFSQGVWEGITGLMATHPPLDVRIRRLEPQWDGVYPPPLPKAISAERDSRATKGFVGSVDLETAQVPAEIVEHAADQVANPSEAHRRYAAELLAAMPSSLVDAVHEPYGARAVIFAMLLDRDADVRAGQVRTLEAKVEPGLFELTLRLTKDVAMLDDRARLPLIDMSLPALRAMSERQYRRFSTSFVDLVEADKQIALFEWALHKILLRHLRPQFDPAAKAQVVYYGLQRLGEPISVLLSALSRASQGSDETAFAAGARLVSEARVALLPPESSGLKRLDAALRELVRVTPKKRRHLVDACAATICADGRVTVREAELLRAICDMLDCPMPPLLAGQSLGERGVQRSATLERTVQR
jgi:Zn-dependent protease with chaperone function